MLELTLYKSARKVLIHPDHIVGIFTDSDEGEIYTAVDTIAKQYCVAEKYNYIKSLLEQKW